MPSGVYERKKTPLMSGGVYALVFNGRPVYVGSTKRLKTRKREHFGQLHKRTHHNHRLQAIADEHHFGALTFEVLEFLPSANEVQLRKREQHWIDGLNPECNIRLNL